jgi:hypothetical protein
MEQGKYSDRVNLRGCLHSWVTNDKESTIRGPNLTNEKCGLIAKGIIECKGKVIPA